MMLQGSIGQFYQFFTENKYDALKILLIASGLFLLPVGRAVELSVLLMAIFGIRRLMYEGRGIFVHKSYYYFTFLFLAFWIPMLIALPDAVNFKASAKTTLLYVRFYFAGVFIISVLRNHDFMDRYLAIISAVVGFFVIDALIQVVTGTDLFGYDNEVAYGRVNGLFGDNLKLGIILSIFSPILIETILKIRKKATRYVLLFVTYESILAIILLSISRASLIMFAVVTIGYVFVFLVRNQKKLAFTGVVLFVLTVTLGYQILDPVKKRIDPIIDVFQTQGATDEITQSKDISNLKDQLNTALSERVDIWETALNMLGKNYFNGIGPRGFRYAYREYANPDDFFVYDPAGMKMAPTHPHQYVVEVLVETGVIGLVGLVLFLMKGSQIMVEAWRDRNLYIYAPAICVLACLFPINTTLSIYSSFWGQIVWFFISLFCASVGMRYKH